jgi:glycosyltransferase involved in cell wall biosynthesis
MTLLEFNVGGSGSYARGLVSALKRRDDVDVHVIKAQTRGGTATMAWLASGARKTLRKVQPDVFHSPGFLTPVASGAPTVITVHDVSLARIPEGQALEWRLYYRWLFPQLVTRAAAVIAPTEVSRRDIAETFGVEARRVMVTPYGVDEQFFRPTLSRAEKSQNPTILFAGPPIKRKNLDIVLEVLASGSPSSPLRRARLLITGARMHDFPEYDRTVAQRGLAERVEWVGTVPYTDLPDLYSRADVFVYPSFLEGFGFPPLEAMACGTPVIASSASCLPEVLDGAALMVGPKDVAGLARAIEAVLGDSALRERLVQAGAMRARGFTWDRCAALTVDVYRAALSS